jgi:hypothetical protein
MADVKSLLVHGLPEMIMSGSLTDGSRSKNHTPAKCIVQPFGVLNDQGWNKNDVSCLYASMKGDRTKLQYASESDIQGHVKNVILDALGITSLDGITCLNELSVFGHRADIWLVARVGKPLGVVEIKKPGINLLNNGHVLGQLYNYMLRLQSFFGVKYVFGIVSTYQKWRFCWLPEANASAIKGTVLSIELAPTPELPKHLQEQSSNQAQQSNHSHERTMFGTEVIDWNNPYLFRALCSVVIKMSKSPLRKVDLIDRKRPYIVADSKQWTWQRNPFSNKLTEIDLHHQGLPLLKDGEKLIFLDDFGAGADGRAWRACTRTGHGCVVKFSGSAETVELELRNWNTLYEDGAARIITLCAQKALIMPYLRPVDRDNSDEIKLVREMIQSVSQKGYCHSDLHWRHVGFRSPVKQKATTRNASLVPVMFDLTQLQKIDPVEALRKNLDQLKLDDSNENQ